MTDSPFGKDDWRHPDHPEHESDWYEHIDRMEDDDPWHGILSRFYDGKFFAERLKKSGLIKHLDKITLKQLKSKKMKAGVEVKGDEFLFLIDAIENRLQNQEIDIEFIKLWGEFEKIYTLLSIKYPEYKSKTKNAVNIDRLKTLQKQWYALWLEETNLNRTEINRQIGEIYTAFYAGECKLPPHMKSEDFDKFIGVFCKEGVPKFKIVDTYATRNFSPAQIKNMLRKRGKIRIYHLLAKNIISSILF